MPISLIDKNSYKNEKDVKPNRKMVNSTNRGSQKKKYN